MKYIISVAALIILLIYIYHDSEKHYNKKSEIKFQNVEEECYQEYNFFNLGLNKKINNNFSYPFVCLDTTKTDLTFQHKLSDKNIVELKFKKGNSFYFREKILSIGKSTIKYHEFLANDSIFTLIYDLSEKEQLVEVSIFSDNILKSFAIKGEIYLPPRIDVIHKVINENKLSSKQEVTFFKLGDSLKATIDFKNISFPNYSFVHEKKIYLGKKDLNWWYIFKFRVNDMQFFDFRTGQTI